MERLSVISLRASDRRQELDSDAKLSVIEQFDPNNLGEVAVVAAFTWEVIGECHQQAHAFLVMPTVGEKIKSFARDIARGSDFLKHLTTRNGRDEPNGFTDINSSASTMILAGGLLHKKIRP